MEGAMPWIDYLTGVIGGSLATWNCMRKGSFAQPLNDRRWAANVRRARAWRRDLSFSEREKFDTSLRPKLQREPGKVIAYPDAFYFVTIGDLLRAMSESKGRISDDARAKN
jgi:hypothetical protein